ncbi:MAG TPA: hypothetical protein VL126_13650 [Bacteroidota bacterium]|nr:hypothetical protein [Bacteroidota bacterium]HUI65882.1 hypothetical protein [Bacteroidota bacterium]
MNRVARLFLVVAMLSTLFWTTSSSCPVCYGETTSAMHDAVNAAVWVLLGVTGTVLGLITSVILRIRRRIRMTLNGSVDYPSVN